MRDIAALTFADWCALRTNVRRILRSPGRTALWFLYALSVVILSVSRAFVGRSADSTRLAAGADYVVCSVLVTFIYSLISGRPAIALFRTRVEARFIIGSPVRAPVAIAYLQVREALSAALRYSFVFVYVVFILAPRSLGLSAACADLALGIVLFIAGATLAVLRRLLGMCAGLVGAIAGIPVALAAAAPMVRDLVVQLPAFVPAAPARWIVTVIPPWHPGSILLSPDPRAFAGVAASAIGGVVALAVAGRDAYPEFYAFAVARLELREFARRPAARGTGAMRRPAIAIPAPGALAFVWKSAVEFRRAVRPAYAAAGAFGLVILGVAAARQFRSHDDIFFAALGLAANLLVLSGSQVALRLAIELRRPLFWLAPDTLFARLCGFAFSQIWQRALASMLLGAGFALGGGSLDRIMLFELGLPALIMLITATGFAAFALFPNVADQRGPIVALRSFTALLLLVPPVSVYLVSGVFRALQTGLIGATLLALFESGCLIGFTARRLDGRIDRVPA